MRKASGHQIIEETGSDVLEGFRKEVTEYKPVMPVVREKTIQRGLSLVAVKIEGEDVNKDLNFDARISDSEVKAKVPSPGAAEREAHNATHCPFRSWCPPGVAGRVPDPQQLELKRGEEKNRVICRCGEREEKKKVGCRSLQQQFSEYTPAANPLEACGEDATAASAFAFRNSAVAADLDKKASGKVRAAILRLEKAMVDSGEASVLDGQPEKMIDVSVDGVEMPITPDVTMPEAAGTAAKGLAAKRQRTEIDNDVEMNASELDTFVTMPDSFFVRLSTQSIGCTPVSWRKCSVPDEGDTVCDKIWVEEWRADEEKGREREVQQLVHVDEVEEAIGCDCSTIGGFRDQSLERQTSLVFAEVSARSSGLLKCSENKDFAVLIVSVAFMHADIEEEIKVKVPAGIESATGFWRLLKALNGTQKASQSWCEHSASVVTGWDASRNDYSGAVFRLEAVSYTHLTLPTN